MMQPFKLAVTANAVDGMVGAAIDNEDLAQNHQA